MISFPPGMRGGQLRRHSSAWPRLTGHTLARRTKGFTKEPTGFG